MWSRALVGLVVVCLVVGAGCGYRWVTYGGSLGDVKRVAIETLRNDSFEPGVESVVTEALLREFQRRGAVALVRNKAAADLVLSGAIKPLTTTARALSSASLGVEFELRMTVDLVATRRDGSVLAIDPTILRDWELYLTSADVEAARKNREEAIRQLAKALASRVYDALAARLGEWETESS